nr:hypothetical protein [Fusobacterium varium]
MIEKIMKAVKSSNKRRGRNITIGAVIGFLLSCTAVMGADSHLWIKEDGGAIKFSTDSTTGADGGWDERNPYSDNNWNKDTEPKTYTNNMILSSNGVGGNGSISYGLGLSGELTNVNFINNGSIIGIMRDTSSSSSGYGIYNSAKMGNITNTGVISGSGIYNNGRASSSGYGIYNKSKSGTIGAIKNTGTISGFADDVNDNGSTASGHGIYNDSGAEIQNIKNTGLISGYGTGRRGSNGYGIYNKSGTNEGGGIEHITNIGDITNIGVISGYGSGTGSDSSSGIYSVNDDFSTTSDGEIGNITNTGIISGSGVGIYNAKSGSKYKMEIGDITNTGVIYGKTNAIKNNKGTIGTVDNYGILATQGDSVIKGTIGTEKNYGLYIGKDGKITVGTEKLGDELIKVVVGYTEDGKEITTSMTIRNATLDGNSGSATSTESFEFKGKVGEYDNSILNGKDETLKVSEGNHELNDSIINAYETAVVMENDSTLILNNTIANGGAAGDGKVPTIEIKGENNTLTLKGESIVNTGGKDNVAITVEGENNVLVLEGNAKVNGEMKATGENNTLNLYGKVNSNLNKSNNISEAASMNILHNITGFTNMNIYNNVTFFEDVKVTETEKVTIAETGTLNLRLKNTGSEETVGEELIPKATHAFSGSTGMIIQGEGTAGTLRFITNGIGKKIYVDMENIELRNLYFKTSSVIDGYEVNDKVSVILGAYGNLTEIYRPENMGKSHRYEALNNIYKGIYNSTDDNLNALRVLISSNGKLGNNYDENLSDEE